MSTVQTATDLASGAMLARGAVKLTAAAIDEDARNQLIKETEEDAKKLAATAEFSVNMAVNPVGTLGGMAVNTYEGYEEASATGEGANYAGKVVGKGVVIYTAAAVGAAAGEVGAVEAAAGEGAAAEAGEIGGDAISPMAKSVRVPAVGEPPISPMARSLTPAELAEMGEPVPSTQMPPTEMPPTEMPPTEGEPPTQRQYWGDREKYGTFETSEPDPALRLPQEAPPEYNEPSSRPDSGPPDTLEDVPATQRDPKVDGPPTDPMQPPITQPYPSEWSE
jgi:hypothetical protein